MAYFLVIKLTWYFIFTRFLLEVASLNDSTFKWVRVNIPQYRVPGEIALLKCDYNMNNNTLYSLKWYKDNEEFFRYVPKASPKFIAFPVDGVNIDMSKSDTKNVVLKNVSWRTSGVYRCEVSAEGPSFASAQSDARMEVVSPPIENPNISGSKEQYQIGEEINLNCTSGVSRPASLLRWYINEQQISKPEVLTEYPLQYHEKGQVSATLGLHFNLTNRHFSGGSMKIKCVASLAPILFNDNSDSMVKNTAIMPELRETLLFVRSSSEQHYSSILVLCLLLLLCTLTILKIN